jgi:pSer/pThr/pTyr-binding forkhead associated (FHA) protein
MDGPGSYRVGRCRHSDLQLIDSRVSRSHCTVECDGRYFWLVDPGSVNGTFVNGKRVRRYLLYAGDRIRAGNSFMVFREVGGEP